MECIEACVVKAEKKRAKKSKDPHNLFSDSEDNASVTEDTQGKGNSKDASKTPGDSSNNPGELSNKALFITLTIKLSLNRLANKELITVIFELLKLGSHAFKGYLKKTNISAKDKETVSQFMDDLWSNRELEIASMKLVLLIHKISNLDVNSTGKFFGDIQSNNPSFLPILKSLVKVDYDSFPIADWSEEVENYKSMEKSPKRMRTESPGTSDTGKKAGKGNGGYVVPKQSNTPKTGKAPPNKKGVPPATKKPQPQPQPKGEKERIITLFVEDDTGRRRNPEDSIFRLWCGEWLCQTMNKAGIDRLLERSFSKAKVSGRVTCMVRDVGSVGHCKELINNISLIVEGSPVKVVAVGHGENVGTKYALTLSNLPALPVKSEEYMQMLLNAKYPNNSVQNWWTTTNGSVISENGSLIVVFTPGDLLHDQLNASKKSSYKMTVDTALGPLEVTKYFPSKTDKFIPVSQTEDTQQENEPQVTEVMDDSNPVLNPAAESFVPQDTVAAGNTNSAGTLDTGAQTSWWWQWDAGYCAHG